MNAPSIYLLADFPITSGISNISFVKGSKSNMEQRQFISDLFLSSGSGRLMPAEHASVIPFYVAEVSLQHDGL